MTARSATSKVKKFFTRFVLLGAVGGLLVFGTDLWRDGGQAAPSQAQQISAQRVALSPSLSINLADLVDQVKPAVVSVKVKANRTSAREPSREEFGPDFFFPGPRRPREHHRPA